MNRDETVPAFAQTAREELGTRKIKSKTAGKMPALQNVGGQRRHALNSSAVEVDSGGKAGASSRTP